MDADEEIEARLEVAQLYEEMGRDAAAARYYRAAADIAERHGRPEQAAEFRAKADSLSDGDDSENGGLKPSNNPRWPTNGSGSLL